MQLKRSSRPTNQIGFFILFFEELVHIIIMTDDQLQTYVRGIKGIREDKDSYKLHAINKFLTIFFKTEGPDFSDQTVLRNILILDKLSTIYKEAKNQFLKLKLEKQTLFYARYCLLNAIIIFNRHTDDRLYGLPFDELLIYQMFCLLQLLFDINIELSGEQDTYNIIQAIDDLIRKKGLSIQLNRDFNRDFTNLNTQRYASVIGLDTRNPLICGQMYYEVDGVELTVQDDPDPVQINENRYDIAQYFEIQFNAMKKESPLDESSVLLLYHSNRNTED